MTSLFEKLRMNATILNYPGFQNLPKGVKQMLLISEAHFFDQPVSHCSGQEEKARRAKTARTFDDLIRDSLPLGIALGAEA